jgi:hypothetical protein
VPGMMARVKRGLSWSGLQPTPALCAATGESRTAAAGFAVIAPRDAAPTPASPAVRRNVRLPGPVDDFPFPGCSCDECPLDGCDDVLSPS